MIKKIIFILLIFIFNSNCSFDTKSGIWTNNEKINKISSKNDKIKFLFEKKKIDINEFNRDYIIKTPLKLNNNQKTFNTNNVGPQFIRDEFNKKSKYNFSRIKYFDYFHPKIIFDKNNLIFFDKKGSVIKFDDTSKVIWKKNNYSKREKKLLPILNLSSNQDILIVTDNLANYYALNIDTGEILWTKNHTSVFISEIKIDEEKFYVIDSDNNLNCFSLVDGEKKWVFQTEYNLIKSQKKLSIVLDESKIYFNNSRGEIYSIFKDNGNLAWVTPIAEDNEASKFFLLKTSQLVLDEDNLFMSNNQSKFFSIDRNTGFINWTQNINSETKPVIAGNFIFSISSDGYLFIIEKNTGNIIRITNIFEGNEFKKIKNFSTIGFAVGSNKIYLSMNNGKILQIDISTGKISSILKISRGKISEPFINEGKMFIVESDKIVKLN